MSYSSRHRSLRLPSFDYRSMGAYFVTICTHERREYLGKIKNEVMGLSEAGCFVWQSIRTLSKRFDHVLVDDVSVVMPNHVHVIIWINPVGAGFIPPGAIEGRMGDINVAPTLGNIVGSLKGFAAHLINKRFHRHGPIWQRNYYDRIIRNERELNDIRTYILNNPRTWEMDQYH